MSEWSTVQKPMIRYAAEAGWEHIPQGEALQRRSGEQALLQLVGPDKMVSMANTLLKLERV